MIPKRPINRDVPPTEEPEAQAGKTEEKKPAPEAKPAAEAPTQAKEPEATAPPPPREPKS